MLGSIGENHGTFPSFTKPSLAMDSRLPGTSSFAIKALSQTTDGRSAQRKAFDFGQLLGEVAVIQVRVARLDELQGGLAGGLRKSTRRRLPPGPMGQGSGSSQCKPGLQTLELSNGQAQGVGSLGVGDLAGQGGLEQAGPGYFLLAQ